MLSTSQKTRLFLNYIHKQMYSISQSSWAYYSQSFLRLPDREGRPCQAMQGGSQDTWQDWVEHYCKWYRFFLFFTNQIALIIKWLHHSTELLQMLTRKWQLSEFPTISIRSVDSNFFLPWSTSRWEFCFVCMFSFIWFSKLNLGRNWQKLKFKRKLQSFPIPVINSQ